MTKSNHPVSSEIDIGKITKELDNRVNDWLMSSEKEMELIKCVNDIAEKFGMIGGAFGVVNTFLNKFQLRRSYSDNDQQTDGELLPFIETKSADALALFAAVDPEVCYSTFIHKLFSVQRNSQRFEGVAKPLEVPEFFRRFAKNDLSPLIIKSETIVATLQKWVVIWNMASMCEHGLRTTIERARSLPFQQNNDTLLENIHKAMGNTMAFDVHQALLPEIELFLHLESSDNNLLKSRNLAKSLTSEKILSILTPKETVNFGMLFPPHEEEKEIKKETNVTLLTLLIDLHSDADFPIIPYLFIKLFHQQKLCHVVLPVQKTKTFPSRVNYAKNHKAEQTSNIPCGMVLLGTFDFERALAAVNTDKIEDVVYLLSPLMRQAAEPISDMIFYGSIQRRKAQEVTYANLLDSITHELSTLQNALGGDLLLDFPSVATAAIGETDEPTLKEISRSWKVIVTPDIYHAAADKLTLWTVRQWLNRVGLNKNGRSLREAITILLKVIVRSHLAGMRAEGVDRESLVNPKEQVRIPMQFNADCLAVENKLKCVTMSDNVDWTPEKAPKTAVTFARMLSAVVSNTLNNLKKHMEISLFSFDMENEEVVVTIENACMNPKHRDKDGGTLSVLRFLASIEKMPHESIVFKHIVERSVWRTSFRLPSSFLTKVTP